MTTIDGVNDGRGREQRESAAAAMTPNDVEFSWDSYQDRKKDKEGKKFPRSEPELFISHFRKKIMDFIF